MVTVLSDSSSNKEIRNHDPFKAGKKSGVDV